MKSLEDTALSLHREGSLREAESAYQQLIQLGTNNYIIYANMAAICYTKGALNESIAYLEKAIHFDPAQPDLYLYLGNILREAHDAKRSIEVLKAALGLTSRNANLYQSLGLSLIQNGEVADAIISYKRALRINPNSPDCHNNLGLALQETGDLAAAICSYKLALVIDPDHPQSNYNLAVAFHNNMQIESAIEYYVKCININPNNSSAHYNLGVALQAQGDINSAINSYRTAIDVDPSNHSAYYNLGVLYQETGNIQVAANCYAKAVELCPSDSRYHHNLGAAFKELGDLDNAICAFGRSLQLDPDNPDATNEQGVNFHALGDLSTAIAYYSRSIELNPNHLKAMNNLGVALMDKGELRSSINCFQKVLRLQPNYPEARKNMSMVLLLSGEYEVGWEMYEDRFQCEEDSSVIVARPSCPQLQDGPVPNGANLLLVCEQGLGDTLQFIRYVLPLIHAGINVSLCAQEKLHALIRESHLVTSILSPQEAGKVSQGYWLPLVSVARLLHVSPDNPIVNKPYIKTSIDLVKKWDKILSEEQKPVIGINWQGNPQHEKTSSIGRSFSLDEFSPIAAQQGFSLLSLQKGYGAEQLDQCLFRHRFVSCQEAVSDAWCFLETAAIVANCDLIITSDTAMAHLAGAMGKTTWLLLKHVPEWRWGMDGDTSFWYPSMRLFRQKHPGNWKELFARVAQEISDLFHLV